MSLRERRLMSSMTPEARAKAEKLRTEGKDPITGRKPGKKAAPCPACEIEKAKDAAKAAESKADAARAAPPSGAKSTENRGGAA
jgi:hypothetical protein